MISPYVRKLRLTAELRALRAEAGLTLEQLGKRVGEHRLYVTRLENSQQIDQGLMIKVLDALGVEGDRWTQLMTIAQEAAVKGWWETTKGIGDRQALYANLEAGAATIREYKQTFMPGLLQIPEYVRARWDADDTLGPLEFSVEGIVAGNAGRQRMLRRPGAPTYEVIIDEAAITRLSAPPDVFKKQLFHLATLANDDPKLSLRVLPGDARIPSYTVPRCTFSLYTYPDPGDPKVVAADSVTSDLVLTDPANVTPYEHLYTALRQAALPQDDSLELLTKAATQLPHN
jgi:transcriptional regulator with XRE-family HTH domain